MCFHADPPVKMADDAVKDCPPPPPGRSPLQRALNYSNVPATASAVHAPSRCSTSVDMGGIHCAAATGSSGWSSYILHIRLGDVEKMVGTIKLSHTDPLDVGSR